MGNPRKKDYSINKNRQVKYLNGTYTQLYNTMRYTAYGDSSPRDRNGDLVLQQNSISRIWKHENGIPGHVVMTQNGVSILGATFGYGNPVVLSRNFRNECIAQASARFKKRAAAKAILAMEYIAERRVLADQLVAICKKLVEIAKLLKQRRFKQIWYYSKRAGRKVAKRKEMTFHEKWLLYHFQIAPMVDDLVTNIERQHGVSPSRVRVRATYRETNEDADRNYFNYYSSTLFYTYRLTYYGEIRVDDPAALTQHILGFNPTDLYDIIPFSFLLDWLWNVGQIIKGLLVPGMTFYNTSQTIVERRLYEHVGKVRDRSDSSTTYSQIGGQYFTSNASYNRTVGPFPDIPLVWEGGVNSLWRAFTALALIRTILN